MSTNPFRRSSLKEPNSSTSINVTADNIRGDQDIYDTQLVVNTKVPSTSQKHVNFASPPAVPISPVSYPPSSPEESRISPAFSYAFPSLPPPTDYSNVLRSDAVRPAAQTDPNDVIRQQNSSSETVPFGMVVPGTVQEKEDAVKHTLKRFASNPKSSEPTNTDIKQQSQATMSHRQPMDVDAFKRMLLTGNSKHVAPPSAPAARLKVQSVASNHSSGTDLPPSNQQGSWRVEHQYSSDSSSETASEDEVPQEIDRSRPDSNLAENSGKRRPPPPKSKHGRAITQTAIPDATRPVDTMTVSPEVSVHLEDRGSVSKTPPAPPLARRKSQRTTTSRGDASQSTVAISTSPAASNEGLQRAPPLPPSRRPLSIIGRSASPSGTPSLSQESNLTNDGSISDRKVQGTDPVLGASRSLPASKRMSMGLMSSPPPPPPPRRGRASSRSSIDSQRPSLLTTAGNTGSTRSSGEFSPQDIQNRKAPPATNANDILADLAALQREVDDARRRAGR